MVSIIIPSYNHAYTLAKTLESIFAQDYSDIEVIVVNDGSSDNTDEVIKPYLNRVQYIKQENKGAPAARNNGFTHSKGEYVMFCDADIIMKPSMISSLLKALEANPDCAYAYPSFMWDKKAFPSHAFDAPALQKMNYISIFSLIRRGDFPGFDESLKKFQDWDLWLTMLSRGKKGVWVNEFLATVIPNKGGMSTWLPSFMYKIPWKKFGIRIAAIEKYEEGMRVIRAKHKLD